MSQKIAKTKYTIDSEQILLECLANIQKSMRDYQRDLVETIEEVKFALSSDE